MSQVHYVRDTSASQRMREIYSSSWNPENYKDSDNITDVGDYHNDVIQMKKRPKWDEMSVDSGFCSDLEKKVAQLSMTGSDVSSIDETCSDVVTIDDVRAPSRAKLTEEEKRLRDKIKTLPVPGRATRWHRCDDVTDYNDVLDECSQTRMTSHSSDRKSKSLPPERNERRRSRLITWDDIELADVRHVRVLGGGGYARVDLVEIRRHSCQRFALKKLDKKLLQDRNQVGNVISEKNALFEARSKFIPRLFKTFHTPNHVFMLTEACLGGDLFSVLENHSALPHDVTQYVIACITEALDHLHRVLNIVHRDVKTENILIDSNGVAKLADLGFCKRLPHNNAITHTFCGTPGYVAPEILLRTGHGRTCDFFSTGVVMFESATCRSPFRRNSSIETHRATLRGIKDVAFPTFVNHATVHMIRSLCINDPTQRLGVLGCEQLRRHEFFQDFDWPRLRQGKMTSPLLRLTSSSVQPAFPKITEDYIETSTAISKPPNDEIWCENF